MQLCIWHRFSQFKKILLSGYNIKKIVSLSNACIVLYFTSGFVCEGREATDDLKRLSQQTRIAWESQPPVQIIVMRMCIILTASRCRRRFLLHHNNLLNCFIFANNLDPDKIYLQLHCSFIHSSEILICTYPIWDVQLLYSFPLF